MKIVLLIGTLLLLSYHYIYCVHGLPTLKQSPSAIDHDAVMLNEVIKMPLGFLKGDVDHVKEDITADGSDENNKELDEYDDDTGVSIRLDSNESFCLFLPPKPGLDVAATETEGTPFCTHASGDHQYPKLPSDLIISSHYVSTPDYVQVTGRMNSDAYNLGSQDGGGQYDNRDVPNVECNGYKYFVNLLEPDVNRYCIRCCQNEQDCPLGKSGYGCSSIVDGDYD